ncbi:MAG: histidine phosphatase family protein [Desulfobacterales bacterium]|nr:MAG: histidine phosphatase family protein [Desulfobacterales bacterium]
MNPKNAIREFRGFPPISCLGSLSLIVRWKPWAACKNLPNFAVWIIVFFLSGIAQLDVAAAQTTTRLEGLALVEALRKGGYNIYFRHAATDWSQNDQVSKEDDWTSCDPGKMRQLSEAGRKTAGTIGEAMRALQIPIGQVIASPYCRTVETARNMKLGPVETTTDIMNLRVAEYFGGTSAIAARTNRRLSIPPPTNTNTVLVAHGNVLVTATDVYPGEAEAIVFRPEGNGDWTFVARITPQEWARLAADHSDL